MNTQIIWIVESQRCGVREILAVKRVTFAIQSPNKNVCQGHVQSSCFDSIRTFNRMASK